MTLGQIAYEAYCKARDYRSVRGELLPTFDNQSPDVKAAWDAAANAVSDEVKQQH